MNRRMERRVGGGGEGGFESLRANGNRRLSDRKISCHNSPEEREVPNVPAAADFNGSRSAPPVSDLSPDQNLSLTSASTRPNEHAQPSRGHSPRNARLSVFYCVLRASCANQEASVSLNVLFFSLFLSCLQFPGAVDTPPCPRGALD